MNFRGPLKLLSFLMCRSTTCSIGLITNRPLHFRTVISKPLISTSVPSCCFRKFSVSSTRQDEDEITNEQMTEMLQYDTELQAMLKDITKDFDPNPPPPEPPKIRQETDIEETDSHHEPHYQENNNSDKMPVSLLQRYKQYKDEDSTIIFDADEVKEIEEEEEGFYLYQDKKDKFAGLNLKRGREGVFDLPELVKILQEENLQDLAVVSIPQELHYASYMIVATAKSPRHAKAVMEFLRKLNKLKKNARDPYLQVGGDNCHEWKVLDIGNIVLHVFLPEVRERYDLETLWTVGDKYDDLCNQPEDPFYDTLEEEMKFLEAAQQVQKQ